MCEASIAIDPLTSLSIDTSPWNETSSFTASSSFPCRNPLSGKPSIVTQANIETLFDLQEEIDNLRGIKGVPLGANCISVVCSCGASWIFVFINHLLLVCQRLCMSHDHEDILLYVALCVISVFNVCEALSFSLPLTQPQHKRSLIMSNNQR